jgi:predicted transposase/invertase (TIGR01784 family)
MTDDERRKYKGYLSFVQSEQQKYLAETGESFYKGVEVGKEKGREETQKEFVLKSHRKGLNIQTICEVTELDEEQVRNIIQNEK